jgi:hypothetical protein
VNIWDGGDALLDDSTEGVRILTFDPPEARVVLISRDLFIDLLATQTKAEGRTLYVPA